MFEHLPIPTAEEIRILRHDDDTTRLLAKLRTDVVSAVRHLEIETLMTLSRQFCPFEDTTYQSAAKFGLEVADALRDLARHGEDVRAQSRAERERLAPITGQTARRLTEICMKLEGINRHLHSLDVDAKTRREALCKAGVSSEDQERVLTAEDLAVKRTALLAEQESLLAEQESLSRFMKTRDETDLPGDFVVPPKPLCFNGLELHRELSGRAS